LLNVTPVPLAHEEQRAAPWPNSAAMMKGRVLAIHGVLNWIGVVAVRLSPRAMVRSIAANLNQPERRAREGSTRRAPTSRVAGHV
jgi:hypothetical protein